MNARDTQTIFKVTKFCEIILKTFQEIFRNICGVLYYLCSSIADLDGAVSCGRAPPCFSSLYVKCLV